MSKKRVIDATHELLRQSHGLAVKAGWWTDLHTGDDLRSAIGEQPKRNVPEQLCLIHSEISEAMEGYRKNLMDDHLPDRPMIEVELADAVIRIMDLSGGLGLDIPGAIADKLEYNASRQDHKIENRRAVGGKRF